MEFICRISRDGGMDFGERNRVYFKSYLKAHPGVLLKITPVLPESDKQRRYLEGAVVPLATYYQEGMDHRNADDRASVREWLKLELANGACGRRGAQNRKVEWGREVLNQFVEDVVGWLQDNYAPSAQALKLASLRELRDGVRWARQLHRLFGSGRRVKIAWREESPRQ
jgi:hypothetical protein